MKLLLTSDGFENPKLGQAFLTMVGKPAAELRILFLPTACRSEAELMHVLASKQELLDLGIPEEGITPVDVGHPPTQEEMAIHDAIYVCGGNTFWLMHRLRQTGFDRVLQDLVSRGLVYVGVSAGSVIAGPDIGIAEPFDENDAELTDFRGLGFCNAAPAPHFGEKDEDVIREYEQEAVAEVTRLRDGEALLIVDGKTALLSR